MKGKKKYSLVCYIEGEVMDRIVEIQTKLFELTGSRACLDSWVPHITLGSGVCVSPEELDRVEKDLESLTSMQEVFEVSLNNFGGSDGRVGGEGEATTPYVLWVDVSVNEPLLGLVESVKEKITPKYDLWWELPEPYQPHVTVAFRDLTKEGYLMGKEYLENKSFSEPIQVSHLSLVEHLPNKDVEYKRFDLQQSMKA
jgi:2'-5' RNA ligase